MSFCVLFAGGGTGGHVFPLLAVAQAMRRERSDIKAVFVGTSRGLEASLLPVLEEHLELLDSIPIKGRGPLGALHGMSRALQVLPQARTLVRGFAPRVVLSLGGYAAGAVSLAASSLGIPVALLEPNSVLGFANRLMRPLVQRAYVVFPEIERKFRPNLVRRYGLPLRSGFSPSPYAPAREGGRRRVLILGGSQGAAALNETLPEAVSTLVRSFPLLEVVHQTGRAHDETVRARYASLGLSNHVQVLPFMDRMAEEIASADVVVARAGAGTIAEICAIGRPAILIPYPHAADAHQRKNAESLMRLGAALGVLQNEATSARLAQELGSLLRSCERRVALADAARAHGRADAAQRVALDLLSLAN